MAKLLGRGAPTTKTYGILGQEYINELTGERYICTKSTTVTSDKAGEADHRCEWALENSGGTGGASSWNDMPDKPFGEYVKNDTLIVDESAFETQDETDRFMWYVKVSDMVLTLDNFANGASLTDGSSGDVYEYSYDDIVSGYNNSGYINLDGFVMIIPHDNFVFGEHPDFTGMTIPKKGIYCGRSCSLTINGFNGFDPTTAVKLIDEKYLPGNFRVVFRDANYAWRKIHDGTYEFEDTVVIDTEYGDLRVLYPTRYDPEDNDMYTYSTLPYWKDGKLCIYQQTCTGSGLNTGEIGYRTIYLTTQN